MSNEGGYKDLSLVYTYEICITLVKWGGRGKHMHKHLKKRNLFLFLALMLVHISLVLCLSQKCKSSSDCFSSILKEDKDFCQ